MKIDRSKVLRAFSDYVEAYDSCNQRITLKIEHSKRVAGLCERIAESNGLKQDDLDLAWTIGLLHEYGSIRATAPLGYVFGCAFNQPCQIGGRSAV